METLYFTGLSYEQTLLATIVSENSKIDPKVRQRAKSLLLLDDGATADEVCRSLSISPRRLAELIHRFRTGGLCEALLGWQVSQASRVWLTLTPSSPPQVQLQPISRIKKRVIDTPSPAATSKATVIAAPLSSTRQACCGKTDVHQADPHHQGGPPHVTSHA
ncbi:MAG: helix-turn-helix domain-containing protein [Verrucomicrobiaceae bacterium]|nr:helix-turn-helix domain-containing protein [Verrucomicrobiaceae bacterium]